DLPHALLPLRPGGRVRGQGEGLVVPPVVPRGRRPAHHRRRRGAALPGRPRRAAAPVPGLREGRQAPRRALHPLRDRARVPRDGHRPGVPGANGKL
ncbi:MAG: hypothetical protein AVDCRST_MAG30-3667, partial [uncultured Solirubrobacteraceae bacterium]